MARRQETPGRYLPREGEQTAARTGESILRQASVPAAPRCDSGHTPANEQRLRSRPVLRAKCPELDTPAREATWRRTPSPGHPEQARPTPCDGMRLVLAPLVVFAQGHGQDRDVVQMTMDVASTTLDGAGRDKSHRPGSLGGARLAVVDDFEQSLVPLGV